MVLLGVILDILISSMDIISIISLSDATPQHINLCILVAQIVSVLYVFMLGIAGMQLCDGACGQFYIVTLLGDTYHNLCPNICAFLDYPSSVIPAWFMYWLVTVQLIRISAASCVYLVPIVVSSEGMILSLMVVVR